MNEQLTKIVASNANGRGEIVGIEGIGKLSLGPLAGTVATQ